MASCPYPAVQAGPLTRVAALPLPDESTEKEPMPSSKRQLASRPLESDSVSTEHVVPHVPQLPESVVVSAQLTCVTTPTTSSPFVPAPIVCAKVRPLAP